jgi:hypothetical protein
MNRAFCTLIAISTLITSGCKTKLFTNGVSVECTQESPSTISTPSSSNDENVIPQDVLPDKALKKPTTSTTNLLRHDIPASLRNPVFIYPVDHSTDSSCPLRNRETAIIEQSTGSWCWAASAETVMSYHTQSTYPNQCDIATEIARQRRGSAADCCADKDHPDCDRTGLPSWAFQEYGFNWKTVKGPLKREKLAGQICDNGPLIFILRYVGGGGHTFVVEDYEYDEDTDDFSVWVYDHSWGGRYIRWPYENYVSGRWEGKFHEHDVNYVGIIPPPQR